MNHKDLTYILSFFKSHNIKTTLWTPGISNLDYLYSILPFTDKFVLFVPVPDRELYRVITGADLWDHFLVTLETLKEEKKSVALNYPVISENIQYLPNIYELAWQQKIPLIIHYYKNNLSKESIAYIKRFRLIRNVLVFKNKNKPPLLYCSAIPLGGINSYWQIIVNYYDEILNSVRAKFKL